jgi:PIN domain nuclease of toxin-antitoxin system
VRLLLDTHAFLFAISEPEQLSPKARKLLLSPNVERCVSSVTLWEIAVKVHIGKLEMPLDREYYLEHIKALKADTLPVEFRHSLALLSLPLHHRDPFDRLLIAQAKEEHLTLLTRDEAFREYSVETVW